MSLNLMEHYLVLTDDIEQIAFNGSEPDTMQSRLESNGIPYHRNDVPHAGLVQFFLNDPNGVKIELNFST